MTIKGRSPDRSFVLPAGAGVSLSTLPRVSVIMPVYNGKRHVSAAIESILGQTLSDFEFIIIDDASTDGTAELLVGWARRDPRIRVLWNETNLGLTPTLNRALRVASAPIIARMDSDDISAPERLERQVAFLEANPDHMFVTTSYRAIDEAGRTLYVKVKPADDCRVRWLMRFRMCLEHPSACFRLRFPDGSPVQYDERFAVGEDFDLFSRLLATGKGAILPQVLFEYRKHPTNISNTRGKEMRSNYLRVARQIQQRDLPGPVAESLAGLLRSYILGEPMTPATVRDSAIALNRMLAHDTDSNPGASVWMRRQAAGIFADAILRSGGGLGSPRIVAAFLLHGRRHLWPLLWRALEDKGCLPTLLESFPDFERR